MNLLHLAPAGMSSAPSEGDDPGFTPATKRRKTSSALFKPFKSPFKGVGKPSEPSPSLEGDATESSRLVLASANLEPTPIATRLSQPPSRPSSGTNASQANAITTTDTTKGATNGRTSPPPAPRALVSANPKSSHKRIQPDGPASSSAEFTSLQRHHTALLSQFSALRSTLDTYTQALKIEHSSRDAELSRLVEVWRSAGRAAAEELYGGVRDRVNRMGGVGAWRERERDRSKGWAGGWDDGAEGNRGAVETGGVRENDEREGWDEGISERREREEAEAEGDEERAREEEVNSGRDDEVSQRSSTSTRAAGEVSSEHGAHLFIRECRDSRWI